MGSYVKTSGLHARKYTNQVKMCHLFLHEYEPSDTGAEKYVPHNLQRLDDARK